MYTFKTVRNCCPQVLVREAGISSRWSMLRAIYAPATIMAILMEIDTMPERSRGTDRTIAA